MRVDGDETPEETEPEYEGFDLARYKAFWKEWVDGYGDARRQNLRDEEYYDGDVKGTGWGHWTHEELQKLGLRNQPPTTRNLIHRKVNAIAGVEQRARSEPRALPRTPKDQYAAEIATDALRFVAQQTRWSSTKAEAFLTSLKIGYAAVEIGGAEDHVPETPIDWKDFFFDPRSRRADFSDAKFLGIAKWLDQDTAIATYVQEVPKPEIPPQPFEQPELLPLWEAHVAQLVAQYQKEVERQELIQRTIETTAEGHGSTSLAEADFDDLPSGNFCDKARKRIFVIDMWHRDPKHGWYRCVFTGNGKLFTEAASLIEKDQWGRARPVHPIQAFSLFVSRELWRYGIVRGMRSPQDEVNFRLSKMLHWLTFNQLFYEPGALGETDRDSARAEIAKPDGVIAVSRLDGVKVERGLDVAAALANASEDARAFLEMEGPNPQLQGEQGRATSGRAVLALQQAGLGQLGPIFDRLYDWEDRCYRSKWARIQQFWTGPMYVRVTDDKNAAKFAAVNGAPVLDQNGEPKQREMMAPPQMGMGAMPGPMMMGHNGGPELTPEDMGEAGPMLAELDMDIIIDRAPEAATLQAEQFEQLVKLAGTPAGASITPRMIVTASALPQKTEMLDQLDKAEQQPKPQEEAQKKMFLAELRELEAKVEKLIAERDKIRAETAKAGASIPHLQAQTAKTGAEARSANVNATMTEMDAAWTLDALSAAQFGPGSPSIDPLAAGDTGAPLGLPPHLANGPPL